MTQPLNAQSQKVGSFTPPKMGRDGPLLAPGGFLPPKQGYAGPFPGVQNPPSEAEFASSDPGVVGRPMGAVPFNQYPPGIGKPGPFSKLGKLPPVPESQESGVDSGAPRQPDAIETGRPGPQDAKIGLVPRQLDLPPANIRNPEGEKGAVNSFFPPQKQGQAPWTVQKPAFPGPQALGPRKPGDEPSSGMPKSQAAENPGKVEFQAQRMNPRVMQKLGFSPNPSGPGAPQVPFQAPQNFTPNQQISAVFGAPQGQKNPLLGPNPVAPKFGPVGGFQAQIGMVAPRPDPMQGAVQSPAEGVEAESAGDAKADEQSDPPTQLMSDFKPIAPGDPKPGTTPIVEANPVKKGLLGLAIKKVGVFPMNAKIAANVPEAKPGLVPSKPQAKEEASNPKQTGGPAEQGPSIDPEQQRGQQRFGPPGFSGAMGQNQFRIGMSNPTAVQSSGPPVYGQAPAPGTDLEKAGGLPPNQPPGRMQKPGFQGGDSQFHAPFQGFNPERRDMAESEVSQSSYDGPGQVENRVPPYTKVIQQDADPYQSPAQEQFPPERQADIEMGYQAVQSWEGQHQQVREVISWEEHSQEDQMPPGQEGMNQDPSGGQFSAFQGPQIEAVSEEPRRAPQQDWNPQFAQKTGATGPSFIQNSSGAPNPPSQVNQQSFGKFGPVPPFQQAQNPAFMAGQNQAIPPGQDQRFKIGLPQNFPFQQAQGKPFQGAQNPAFAAGQNLPFKSGVAAVEAKNPPPVEKVEPGPFAQQEPKPGLGQPFKGGVGPFQQGQRVMLPDPERQALPIRKTPPAQNQDFALMGETGFPSQVYQDPKVQMGAGKPSVIPNQRQQGLGNPFPPKQGFGQTGGLPPQQPQNQFGGEQALQRGVLGGDNRPKQEFNQVPPGTYQQTGLQKQGGDQFIPRQQDVPVQNPKIGQARPNEVAPSDMFQQWQNPDPSSAKPLPPFLAGKTGQYQVLGQEQFGNLKPMIASKPGMIPGVPSAGAQPLQPQIAPRSGQLQPFNSKVGVPPANIQPQQGKPGWAPSQQGPGASAQAGAQWNPAGKPGPAPSQVAPNQWQKPGDQKGSFIPAQGSGNQKQAGNQPRPPVSGTRTKKCDICGKLVDADLIYTDVTCAEVNCSICKFCLCAAIQQGGHACPGCHRELSRYEIEMINVYGATLT